jgi:hypothetical protein
MDAYDGFEPTAAQQSFVNEDMERILDYSTHHADEYGGRWHNPDRTYGVSFTASLDVHERAVRSILNLPERLVVQSCQHSYAALLEVCERIRVEDWDLADVGEEGRVAIAGLGSDERGGVVRVRVQRSRPDVASRLRVKYGSLVVCDEGEWPVATGFT